MLSVCKDNEVFYLLFLNKGYDVTVLNPASWPTAKDLKLDDSQFDALQLALTKEFAVIQGPPGTGKTHIGLKVCNNNNDNNDNTQARRGKKIRESRFSKMTAIVKI